VQHNADTLNINVLPLCERLNFMPYETRQACTLIVSSLSTACFEVLQWLDPPNNIN